MSKKDDMENFTKAKERIEAQMDAYRQKCRELNVQCQKEGEQRMLYEAKSKSAITKFQKAMTELQNRENELEEMAKYIRNLEDEQKYERSLRDTPEEDEETKLASEQADESSAAEMEMRLEEDGPEESCRYYAKLARISQREC